MDQANIKQRKLLPSRMGAIIEFTEGEEKGRKVPLIYTRTTMGRKSADIMVRDIKVSSQHVVIDYLGGSFRIRDLNSSNGTFIKKRKIREAMIEADEEIRIGLSAFRIVFDAHQAARLLAEKPIDVGFGTGGLTELIEREFIHAGETQKVSFASLDSKEMEMNFAVMLGPAQGKKFTFKKAEVLIGRINADVQLNDRDVSRKHALVERQEGGQIILRDLASTNGTHVNDRKISNCVLSNGDKIRMGNSTMVFSLTVKNK